MHLFVASHFGHDSRASGVGDQDPPKFRVAFAQKRLWTNTANTRFLQLVESRLSQLESDVRILKSQPSQTGSVSSEPIMGDRRGSLSTYTVAVSIPEAEAEDEGTSPDATDGIGSIEFTREEDSGYYGMRIPTP